MAARRPQAPAPPDPEPEPDTEVGVSLADLRERHALLEGGVAQAQLHLAKARQLVRDAEMNVAHMQGKAQAVADLAAAVEAGRTAE